MWNTLCRRRAHGALLALLLLGAAAQAQDVVAPNEHLTVSGVLREDAERQFIMLKNRQEKLPISRQFTHLFKQM